MDLILEMKTYEKINLINSTLKNNLSYPCFIHLSQQYL